VEISLLQHSSLGSLSRLLNGMTLSCLDLTFNEVKYIWQTGRRSFARTEHLINHFPDLESSTYAYDDHHVLRIRIPVRLALRWSFHVTIKPMNQTESEREVFWESGASNEVIEMSWQFPLDTPDMLVDIRRSDLGKSSTITHACDSWLSDINNTQASLLTTLSSIDPASFPTEEDMREYQYDLGRVDAFLDAFVLFADTEDHTLIRTRQTHLYKLYNWLEDHRK
jgi:hypothetical protein